MDFRILGPLEVHESGRALPLGGSTPRALLAVLLPNANRIVSRARLIEEVWGDEPPETAGKMIQIYVSQLRKALDDAPGALLVTRPPGYVLELDPERVDAARCERLVRQAREARAAGDPESAAATLRDALGLWRGPALGDLAELPFARAEAARLEELRLVAIEERIDAELELGAHEPLVAELEALVAEHPLRERLRSQLMLALYRSGRHAEALEAYQQTRRLLVDELGIEPSRTLQLLERAVLQQDPSLDAPARPDERIVAPHELREARKTVSVVFVELVRLGERLDPEALRRVMAEATDVVARVLERHGASVETRPGGGVMAVFGVPAVHEDDALRAVSAAAEVRGAVRALSEELAPKSRLAVRAGVSTGEVVSAGLAVEGDSVHEAARLEQAAEPGEILIARDTEALVRDAVVTEGVDRSRAGWNGALAVAASRLVEVAAEFTPVRLAVAPMVGRERELAQLRDLFERAVSERAVSLCVVLGPAGIGKSRLAEEFAALLDEQATVLSGRCLSYGEAITFWPIVQLVRETAGEASREALARLLADERDGALVADRVAAGIGLVTGAATNEETFWAVRKLLEALARPRPLVVVVDDVHRAEATLLDLVEHVVDWSSDAPILFLCLARPELLDDRPSWAGGKLNITSIRLGPLSERETEALLRKLPGAESLDKDDWARIAEAAEGNPLFIHQMVAMLSEDGERVAGELSVPPSIHALLAARLERLAPAERALLERASVVGKEFWRGALIELSPEDERGAIDEHLQALIRKELVAPGRAPVFPREEGLRFRHLLIREAVYESVPKEARAELHERFADSLDRSETGAGEFDEIGGYHLEQAYRCRAEVGLLGEHEQELAQRAADRLAAAGRRACARGDMLAGVGLLSRASSLVPETSVARADLLSELGEALREAGDFTRADEVLTEAIARAAALREWAAEANADLLRMRLRIDVDPAATPGQLMRAGQRAIELFEESGDDRRLARAWLILAWAPWLQGRVVEAEKALERAIEHARRAGDERTEAQSLHLFVGAGFFGPSPVPEAMRRCQEVLAGMPEQQRIVASASRALAGLLAMQGDFDAARTLIEREKRILAELGLGAVAAFATEVYGLVELLAGDPAAAERELRAGYETLEQMGERTVRSTIAAMLAEALAALGRDDEAFRFTEISEQVAAADDLAPQVQWRAVRAKLLARRGDQSEAERLARKAVELAEQTPDFIHLPADALMSLAEVLREGGAHEEASEAVREALALYERKDNRVSAGRARALLAELATERV